MFTNFQRNLKKRAYRFITRGGRGDEMVGAVWVVAGWGGRGGGGGRGIRGGWRVWNGWGGQGGRGGRGGWGSRGDGVVRVIGVVEGRLGW